jgi:hypothetical protein
VRRETRRKWLLHRVTSKQSLKSIVFF